MENLITTTIYAIKTACQVNTLKCITAIGITLSGYLFGETNAVVFVGIMILCFIDFITAVVRDKKLGVPIESKKAVRTAVKIATYGLLVSAGYITETIISSHFIKIPIAGPISAFIAITELISVLENVGKMGYVVPQKLLNLLSDYVKKQ